MKEHEKKGSEEWLTKAEIAAHLKCTPRYINTLMRRGILPYLKTRGLLRFNPDDCSLALQRFKTRSRFSLDNQSPSARGPVILSGNLAKPLSTEAAPHSAASHNGITTTVQKICAKAFESPEEARKYLEEMIQASIVAPSANDALNGNEKASITVIILQSTPVFVGHR